MAESAKKPLGSIMTLLDVAYTLVKIGSARVGCPMIEVFTGPNGTHNIHVRCKPIPGNTSGYAYFNDGTGTDHVNHVIDSTITLHLMRFAGLGGHELGHNKNLEHEFPGQERHHSVMSYRQRYPYQGFSTGQPPYREVRDASWPELLQFFNSPDGVPYDPFNPDPPTPPGPAPRIPGRLYIDNGVIGGEVTVYDRQYISTPEPGQGENPTHFYLRPKPTF
jgi:hypothetical protein